MKRLLAALPLALLMGCGPWTGTLFDQLDLDRARPGRPDKTEVAADEALPGAGRPLGIEYVSIAR